MGTRQDRRLTFLALAAALVLSAISAASAGLPYLGHFHAGVIFGVVIAWCRWRAPAAFAAR